MKFVQQPRSDSANSDVDGEPEEEEDVKGPNTTTVLRHEIPREDSSEPGANTEKMHDDDEEEEDEAPRRRSPVSGKKK